MNRDDIEIDLFPSMQELHQRERRTRKVFAVGIALAFGAVAVLMSVLIR